MYINKNITYRSNQKKTSGRPGYNGYLYVLNEVMTVYKHSEEF